MKTYYFTFGQTHVHSVNGFTYDKDVVVQINANDYGHARTIMADHFLTSWAFQYEDLPDLRLYPRGVKVLNPLNGNQITEQFEFDLKEAAHWFGWDELRKVIDRLEENDKIAASERSQDPTRN